MEKRLQKHCCVIILFKVEDSLTNFSGVINDYLEEIKCNELTSLMPKILSNSEMKWIIFSVQHLCPLGGFWDATGVPDLIKHLVNRPLIFWDFNKDRSASVVTARLQSESGPYANPDNTKYCSNADLMLAHLLWRWSDIKLALGQRLMLAGEDGGQRWALGRITRTEKCSKLKNKMAAKFTMKCAIIPNIPNPYRQ